VSASRGRAAIAASAVLGVGLALLGPAAPGQSSTPTQSGTAAHERVHAAKPKPSKPGKPGKPTPPKPSKPKLTDSAKLRKAVKTPRIVNHLRQFQAAADRYGDRAAGHEGYNAASRYVESRLRAAGYSPRRQYFDFVYTRVNANTVSVGGEEIANDVLTGSPSTPAGGVTADLVTPVVAQGCDAAAWAGVELTGQIALVNRGTCSFQIKSEVAKAAGAAAVVIWNNAPGPLTNATLGESTPALAPTTGISQEDGQALLADLAGGPVEATVDLDVTVEERRTWNVIAETRRGRADDVVMVGSHLDGVQDGAAINDNASGSATLLETAIQLKKMEGRLRNKVRFAWWGAEELGLLGSTHYVDQLVQNDPEALDDIAVYLNYDMVASPNYIIGVYDADESTEAASAPVPAGSIETERLYRSYFRSVKQPVVDTAFSGRSDYQAFIENGVAAGGLFSGGDGVKTEEQARLFGGTAGITFDPNYHTPADDISNISRRSLDIMSDAIAHMTIRLGRSTVAIDTPDDTVPSGGRSAPRAPEGVLIR